MFVISHVVVYMSYWQTITQAGIDVDTMSIALFPNSFHDASRQLLGGSRWRKAGLL